MSLPDQKGRLRFNEGILLAIVLTAIVVSGVAYWWHQTVMRGVTQELAKAQRDGRNLIISQEELHRKIKDLQAKLAQLKGTSSEVDFLTIYGTNPHTDEELIQFYVPIPRQLSLLEKMQLLGNKLSILGFSNNPIRILKIENRKGKKIAVIELKEGNDPNKTWLGLYFQGSTGGHSTTVTLMKTFLQGDYQGEWVDGIEFYYLGGRLTSVGWDHLLFDSTMYRSRSPRKELRKSG
jgi:hypothetical protein